MIWLLHAANVLYLVAYLVRDILWLRVVTLGAGLTLLAAFLTQPNPPWAAVAWNLVFFAINLVHVALLVRERRPVPLDAEEATIHQRLFPALRPRALRRFLSLAPVETHPAGATLIHAGTREAGVVLLLEGAAHVPRPGAAPIALGRLAFAGEMGFLTGRPAAADVLATTAVRARRWPADALRAALARDPELRVAWQQAVGGDLVAKLRPAASRPTGRPADAALLG